MCAVCTVPSHFSRICTVSPISSGRPCWTVPRKLASTAKKRHTKHPREFVKSWKKVQRRKAERCKTKRLWKITITHTHREREEVQSINCVGEIKSKLRKYLFPHKLKIVKKQTYINTFCVIQNAWSNQNMGIFAVMLVHSGVFTAIRSLLRD